MHENKKIGKRAIRRLAWEGRAVPRGHRMSRPIGVSKKSMMENYASEVARCYTDSGLNFLYEDFIWRAPLVVVMVYLIRFSPRFLVSKFFLIYPLRLPRPPHGI